MRSVFAALAFPFVVVWRCVVVATPLLGAWLASSLAAFFGGPKELATGVAVLLFPIVPLLWEVRSAAAFARKEAAARAQQRDPPRRLFGFVNRLVVRTLVVNGLFLALLLALWPKVAFTALATRGDWFVDGERGAFVDGVRSVTAGAARGLEWLHRLANPNPYKKDGDDAPVPDDVVPVDDDLRPPQEPEPQEPEPKKPEPKKPEPKKPEPKKPEPKKPEPKKPEPKKPEPMWSVGQTTWPQPETLASSVTSLSPAQETSIAAVGQILRAREPEPFARAKAVHDWIVDRLHYDKDSLVPGRRKPQDAQTVFRLRMGVCEGYARLFVALAAAAGLEAVYVVGDVREDDGAVAPIGHAWNAVKIDRLWYLVDVTWDDPASGAADPDGRRGYRTDYLFVPPSLMILNHFPDQPQWQLLSAPLARAAFVRQPGVTPGLAKHGLTLVEPGRPHIVAQGAVSVVVDNPARRWLMIDTGGSRCDPRQPVSDAARVSVTCPVQRGRQQIELYASREKFGDGYVHVGTVLVDGR